MRRIAVGEEITHVAQDLGFSPSSARRLIKSPLFQKELTIMQSKLDESLYDAFREIRQLQPEAVQTLKQLVKNKKRPDLRLAAAKEILNRTGITAPTQLEVSKTEHISYEQRLQIATDEPKQLEYIDSEITVLAGEDLEASDEHDEVANEPSYDMSGPANDTNNLTNTGERSEPACDTSACDTPVYNIGDL